MSETWRTDYMAMRLLMPRTFSLIGLGAVTVVAADSALNKKATA
ncbi:MAG: hypothetical protein AAGF98_13935 [Cyanobacteria bacterium P01_H01_bin.153]